MIYNQQRKREISYVNSIRRILSMEQIKAFFEKLWADLVAFIQSIWDREVGSEVEDELKDAYGDILDSAK